MKELTERQAEVLAFVREQISTGLPPSLREIGRHFGMGSTNGVNDHLRALERKGFIRRGSKSRAIFLVAEDGGTGAPPEYLVKVPSRSRRPKIHRRRVEDLISALDRFVAERPFASPELTAALEKFKEATR